MRTITAVKQQTATTTTLVVGKIQNYTPLEQHFHVVRYVLPDRLRNEKNATYFGRVHNTLREYLNYPYQSYKHDPFDGVHEKKWAVYVLYPKEVTPVNLVLPWFGKEPLPFQEIAFPYVPIPMLIKLLQIRFFCGIESSRFVGRDQCYVYARSGGKDFHYCVEVELKSGQVNTEDGAQEFAIIPHARRFGTIPPPFQPSRALYGKRPVGNQFFFLHLKPGAEALEQTVYDIVTFPGKRAQIKFHDPDHLDESKGKIVFDFQQQFLQSLADLGIPAHIKKRTLTLAHTQKDVDVSKEMLQTVGVYDNRLQRMHPLDAYIALLRGIYPTIHFIALENIRDAPHGGVLVLLDVKAEDFEEEGILAQSDQRDPYGKLYAEHLDIPKQSLNVNTNDPNALEGGEYLDYPMIQSHDEEFAQKIKAVFSELYLKCAIIYGFSQFPLPFIPEHLAFVRKARYAGESFRTALWFEQGEPRFVNLGNPPQAETFYRLLGQWGVDWDEQYEQLLHKLQRAEDDGTRKELPTFDIIVGHDLFVAIEQLDERILYNYHEIARRKQEQRVAYPIAELKLAPHYDDIKRSGMLSFDQLIRQDYVGEERTPPETETDQSLLFYKQLEAYDTLLDEIAITHPQLSYQELTSGAWLERICHIFGSKARASGKYHRQVIAQLYKKRKRFLTERGDNVRLYQGIWCDEENVFLVGSPTAMKMQGQEHAHLVRRFQVMQGSAHFEKERFLATMGVLFVRPQQFTVSPYYFHLIDLYVENILRYTAL